MHTDGSGGGSKGKHGRPPGGRRVVTPGISWSDVICTGVSSREADGPWMNKYSAAASGAAWEKAEGPGIRSPAFLTDRLQFS